MSAHGPDEQLLSGHTVVVLGGSSGIGLATARRARAQLPMSPSRVGGQTVVARQLFPVDLSWIFVWSQSPPGGVAEVSVGGLFGVDDLADEVRADPDGVTGLGSREVGREGTAVLSQWRQPLRELVEHAVGEPGAHAADVLQVAVLVGDAENQGADAARTPAPARAPARDDDFLRWRRTCG